jgi:sRNA-binding carbon storage regulator CsrA
MLALSIRRGQDVFVGDVRVVVTGIESRHRFTVRVGDVDHVITDERATEVLPDVFISAGDRVHEGMARMVFDVPDNVVILRGERYREVRGGVAV